MYGKGNVEMHVIRNIKILEQEPSRTFELSENRVPLNSLGTGESSMKNLPLNLEVPWC